MHGYGVLMRIRRVSDELLIVEGGSLYPALHRIEQNGWGPRQLGNYRLRAEGKVVRAHTRRREQLANRGKKWAQVVRGVDAILRFA